MRDWIQRLNPEQRKAVTTTVGPVLVLAGAGTGKTRVITVRIAHMLAQGVNPANILAVTFTNKAAGEMRERIAELVGKKRAEALTVGTFHAFCVRLLRANAQSLGLPKDFAICDASDQLSALKGVLRELHVAETHIQPGVLQSRISLAKNRLDTPEAYLERASDDYEELIGRAWKRYAEHLARQRQVDFDDLLVKAVELLGQPDKLRRLRERFLYVLVDEFQDTNAPQYEVVHGLAGKHRNLCAVGDDDQSIYGWRGADVQKILGFEKDFPEAVVVRLETNYRSTKPILEAANRVIRNNPARHEKELRSALGDGPPIRVGRCDDELNEAGFVVREITAAVRTGKARHGDFAILFRTSSQPRVFEQELRARAVPYKLVGGPSFFDRKEIRDVLAYLRLIANPVDEASFLRIVNRPPRGVGKTSLDRALAFATEHGVSILEVFDRAGEVEKLGEGAARSVAGLRKSLATLGGDDPGRQLVPFLKRVLETVGYRSEVERAYPDPRTRDDRWATVMELCNAAENHVRRAKKPSLAKFLEEVALAESDDRSDDGERRDQVSLMTLHAAKGLEFPRVYLVGVEEGLLPHARSVAEDSVEEERRLAYVGVTRAMEHLTVTWAAERSKFGTRVESQPSRFVFELRDELPPKEWIPVERMAQESAKRGRSGKKKAGARKATRRKASGRRSSARG